MRIKSCSLALALSLTTGVAGAQVVIYDNGGPNLVNAFHSDYDLSGPSDTVQVGDDFTVGAAATFNFIRFYGVYAFDNVPAAADDFVVRVFAHPPTNQPPTNEYAVGNNVTRADTGINLFSFDVYEYTVAIPDTNVAAGQHFLSIVNNTVGTVSDWFWCTSAPVPMNSYERDTDAQPWLQDNNSYAFTLILSGGLGSNYCGPAVVNSAGQPATISAAGSNVAANDDVELMAADMPPNQFGYFLNSQMQAFVFPVPGSQGALCLGGQIGRYNASVFNTGAGGTGSLVLSLPNTPTPTGTTAVVAGQTWNFTTWFRDNNPGPTSNFSDGLSILFQ